MRKVAGVLFWAVMIVAPIALTAVGLAGLPAGTESIPLQVGFDGEVSRSGAPSELWVLGGIMAGCNALLGLCYRFNDVLYDHGLVHGVSRKGALVAYSLCALFLVAVTVWAYWFLLSKVP